MKAITFCDIPHLSVTGASMPPHGVSTNIESTQTIIHMMSQGALGPPEPATSASLRLPTREARAS